MRTKKIYPLLAILLGLALLLLGACGGQNTNLEDNAMPAENTGGEANTATEPEPEPEPELFGDAIRGGLLYDKWWKIVGADEPTEDHPLWSTQTTNTRSGDDTWRCKECHGWDYKGTDGAYGSGSHFTGFPGVYSYSGGSPNEVLAVLKGSTNADHDFSSYMDDQALTDLALFISGELLDFGMYVDSEKMSMSSDVATGGDLYSTVCAECHGVEGLAINFDSTVPGEYLPGLGLGNPWETLHKMRFGQPGVADMPSAIDLGWTVDEQNAVLAYIQTLPEANPVSQGGLLYDKYWKALGLDEPTEDHPLWSTQTTNTRSGADTWRCKECHGWDYRGAEGAYSSGSHYTGFTGVMSAQGYSAEEITAWMDGTNNADHDFSVLGETGMEMMIAFLQEGTVDMTTFIGEDKAVIGGDAAKGGALFEQGCARCHGDDGKGLNFGDESDPEYLGGLADGNPWETFHKAYNGQPGEPMTVGRDMGWTMQDLIDLLAYLQTLE